MIASYTQLLAKRCKGKIDQDADDFISYAVDGANRMQKLINDLLEYSRVISRGKPSEPVDCELLVRQAMENLRLTITENNAVITHSKLPVITADSSQLVQAFQNLLNNAIKFKRPDNPPQIHINVQENDEEWLISVKDNGIGIENQYFERIFVIFQRLHSRREYAGNGIGLSVCKKIIERHGGKIWIESEVGKGTTFFFTIPRKNISDTEGKILA